MSAETPENQRARWEAQKPIIAIMLKSSCFGHEICKSPPCQCAQDIIDAVTNPAAKRVLGVPGYGGPLK